MAFVLNPDGSIKVDTADELRQVLEVRDQAARKPPSAEVASSVDAPATTIPLIREAPKADVKIDKDTAYRQMFKQLDEQPNQQTLLRLLLRSQQMVTDTDLRVSLRLSTNLELRGLMIGIIRRAKNRGLQSPS